MSNPNYEALRDAVARNSAAVLSLPSAGMVRHQRTRFLAEAENGFWIEYDPSEQSLIDSLSNEGAPVGVSFKVAQMPLMFISHIRGMDRRFQVNAATAVSSVFLPFPENFRARQRRQVYRVSVPMSSEITLRAWHIPEHAVLRDRPLASREIVLRLTNISTMGIAAIAMVGRDKRPVQLVLNERLRMMTSWDDQELLTEARVIHFRRGHDPMQIAFGIQFKRMDRDIEGRQAISKLNELVGTLQREEIKLRRGMAEVA